MITSEKPVHVLIADSQFLITESLKLILQNDGRFIIDRVVSDKNDLISSLKSENSSFLIIDPSLIDFTGLTDLKEIRLLYPDLKLLIITNSITKKELHELNSMGITSIILKSSDEKEFFDALNSALNGKKYYSGELLDLLFEANDRKNPGEDSGLLTNSELEIVRLISEGLTTKEIASLKFLSFHTVTSHRKNIFRKLGVTSVSELIMYSIKSGWINTIEYHI
jgi:DNA-binding NarL/FixJ family response regulator